MRQLVGVIGSGIIGTDPFDVRSWSGSSRRFFLECHRRGLLSRAFGVELSRPYKGWFAFKNFSSDRHRWRTQLYSDPGYRRALTRLIHDDLLQRDYESDILQIGAMYDIPSITEGRTSCYSYNDANFLMALRSPFLPKDIGNKRIDAILNYETQVNNRLDTVFTMSEHLRRCFIQDYGVNPEKAVCIGAGVNLDELPAVNDNKDYSTGTILFIGIEFRRKGGYEVLEAFKTVREKIPYATLHIVGPRKIPPGVESSPGVVWHGYLSKTNEAEMLKLRVLFSEAALFVMPSLYEPFGIAPLEAMAHCVPCVVSRAWALPEIVPDGMCGRLVTPGSSEELSVVLTDLLRNPECLSRYGVAARKHVERGYTWPAVVDRLQVHISTKSDRRQAREGAPNLGLASPDETTVPCSRDLDPNSIINSGWPSDLALGFVISRAGVH